ncbi:hypothetical protein [Phenylobacterium sp. LH3H17]|nr:hypothetical protein [Phenylobacterium sp. LH3H17]
MSPTAQAPAKVMAALAGVAAAIPKAMVAAAAAIVSLKFIVTNP